MITIMLDGLEFNVVQGTYKPPARRGMTTRRTVTGAVDRTESGIFAHTYSMTLYCTYEQMVQLEAIYAKYTPPNNLLDFVDERGFDWNPNAGTNDSQHAYSTGVYLDGEWAPERESDSGGWDEDNMFNIPIQLIVNSKGWKS